MLLRLVLVAGLFFSLPCALAQWKLEPSHTSSSFRGIHATNDRVAWASGTAGTVLLTQDGGLHWQHCAVPPGAESLDFRGIWAWDATTAVVMSAGPGEQSRLYQTNDGCSHWSEQLRGEKNEFWDAVAFQVQDLGALADAHIGVLIGDPVDGRFLTHVMIPGHGWFNDHESCVAREDETAYAASNSSVVVFGSSRYIIVTGGRGGPRALLSPPLIGGVAEGRCSGVALPIAGGSDSSGAFSIAFRDSDPGLVVGGDYKNPTKSAGTAAWTADGGRHWSAATSFPHGYRSGVAWDSKNGVWIAVGTNGSDLSLDDGKNWRKFDEGKWNAVSPPYAVGPDGRIGTIDAAVIYRIRQQKK